MSEETLEQIAKRHELLVGQFGGRGVEVFELKALLSDPAIWPHVPEVVRLTDVLVKEQMHGLVLEAEVIALNAQVSELQAKLAGQGEKIYVEARRCRECDHIGINDSHEQDAACHFCRWHGPSPEKDECPECESASCMGAACPKCSGLYELEAEAEIVTHPKAIEGEG